eukprot:s2122_g33.t2
MYLHSSDSCRPANQAGVAILWPRPGQTMPPTMSPFVLRTKIWGDFRLKESGHIIAVITGTDADRGHEMSTFSTLRSDELNIEVFGLQSGKYFIKAFLVDGADRTRSCWYTHTTSFVVQKSAPDNRTDALRRNLRLYEAGYRGRPAAEEPLLLQPRSGRDFAYVTIIWSEDYVDNAIVWATGLIASGSTFRRLCMVARGKIERRKIRILSRCCCDIDLTDPIQSPALSSSRSSRYEFVLTKLRVLQLDQKGIRKIVMMDADTLVLQNVDELFWLPSPSATVNKDTLMGELEKPKLSAGVMVLEPDSVKFDHLLEGLHGMETSQFVEQDLLDAYFNHSYNIIPLTYNLYPELLDVMPFLHFESDSEANDMLPNFSFPMDNGIKIVHLWHLFNPFQTFAYAGAQYLQINAKMVHRQMWRWYTLFWTLHQLGLQRGAPEEYPKWKQRCVERSQAFGPVQSRRFVPVLGTSGGIEVCRHVDGLAW